MAQRHVVLIQGHPDPQAGRFGHALADAYAQGAQAGGHQVERIDVAKLDFPWLRTKADFETGAPPPAIAQCQQAIRRADHLVIFYPLWLGTMPALLKAFLEQTLRPGFAFSAGNWNMKPLLKGKTARIVITMGMPALIYRWYFRSHSLKSLKSGMLAFVGIGPIKVSLIGMVESKNREKHERWLQKMHAFGKDGA